MTEKEAKKPDYSNSAEKLINPPEVKALLDKLHNEQGVMTSLEAELQVHCAEIVEAIAKSGVTITELQKQIKAAVETHGSYQNVEAGEYAVKYRRMSKSYHVEPFKKIYEKYAPAVIEETINVKALEGLVKGGLISEENLKANGTITETPTFAFFIR